MIKKINEYSFFKELCALNFIEKIILYGSRARNDNQERADIDIAISYKDKNDENWLKIEKIIEDADTLLKIDCIRLEDLSQNSELKKILPKKEKFYMKNQKIELRLEKLKKALTSLETIINEPIDKNRANIDASIQRFEFVIELFWNYLKAILENKGVEAQFPKDVLQESYKGNLIDDELIWLKMLKDRNATSRTYDEELANQIYARIKNEYVAIFRKSLDKITSSQHS